jgi:hypothetical protein
LRAWILARRMTFARFAGVSELPAAPEQEILCPHCKKPFEGRLLSGRPRQRGFKCPHCRLFVPVDRADGNGALPQPS